MKCKQPCVCDEQDHKSLERKDIGPDESYASAVLHPVQPKSLFKSELAIRSQSEMARPADDVQDLIDLWD